MIDDVSRVPNWPLVRIEMADDGTVTIDGEAPVLAPGDDARTVAMGHAIHMAALLGRPVRVEARESDGTVFPLVVDAAGNVEETGPPIPPAPQRRKFLRRRAATANPVPAPPVAPGPDPEPYPTQGPFEFPESDPVPYAAQGPFPFPAPDPEPYAPQGPFPFPAPDLGPTSDPFVGPEPYPAQSADPFPEVDPYPMPPLASRVVRPHDDEVGSGETGFARERYRFAPDSIPHSDSGNPEMPRPTDEQARVLASVRVTAESGDPEGALARLAELARDAEGEAALALREVEAYLTLLGGDAVKATRLYLRTALDVGRLFPAAPAWALGVAECAHHCWLRVDDPERAYELGHELVNAYAVVDAADSVRIHHARTRITEMRGHLGVA